MDEYITIKEIIKKLRVSRTTIDRWRGEGMPFYKFGRGVRFVEKEVMNWFKDREK